MNRICVVAICGGLFAVCSGATAADAEAKPVVKVGGNFEVQAIRDIAYHTGKDADPAKNKLDLFLPKGKKDFPIAFFIHGGAWRSGDRKFYGGFGQVCAKNGIGAVVISYRLSPQVQHPGHIEDVARAFAWTVNHIAEYGGRTDQIFVTGQSAGGHLAALLATNEKYLKAVNLTTKAIHGVIPISGIYTVGEGWMERVFGKGATAAESASPVKHVTGKEPPFLILYADKDFATCAPMSTAFQAALKNNKVEADLCEIKNRNHISIMVLLMSSEGDPSTQALFEFIAKHSDLKLMPRNPS